MASQPNGGFTRRHRGWLILLAILVGVVLLAAMSRRNSGVLVRSATVARGNIRAVISTNGKIEPQQNFRVEMLFPQGVPDAVRSALGPLRIWVVLDGYLTRDVQ